MPREILVDQRVYDLAEFWLDHDDSLGTPAHEARVLSLAQDIQQAIEGWCEDETRAIEERDARDAERRSLRHLTDTERERI